MKKKTELKENWDENLRALQQLKEELDAVEIKREVQGAAWRKELAFLDDMVGMEPIKQRLLDLGRYMGWTRWMAAHGNDVSLYPTPNLTFLFLGEPGTGKTTLAKHMGDILYSMGLIRRKEVFIYRREDLVGENYGCEEELTREALENSRDAVLVLDEAYQCFKNSSDRRDPAYHILETLMAEFGEPGRCIILAGYKDEMMELMQVNPGFRSRIPEENILLFSGPSEEALFEIVDRRLGSMKMRMTPDAKRLLHRSIHEQYVRRDRSFGNARQMCQMADAILFTHAQRFMESLQSNDCSSHSDSLLINSVEMQTCLDRQSSVLQTIKTKRSSIGFA